MPARSNLYMVTKCFFLDVMHGVVQVILANERICASRDVGNVL